MTPIPSHLFLVVFTLVSAAQQERRNKNTLQLLFGKKTKPDYHALEHRPSLVQQAFASNEPLYYFGLGSNMLRSKIENRSSNGTIEILSIEAAFVRNHRLGFSMRGFPPLEPAMGSLEPIPAAETSDDEKIPRPLHSYTHEECHGALVQLTPDNYQKLMRSEGVGLEMTNSTRNSTQQPPGYEEIVVTAHPYTNGPPVSAIALRARPHVRLSQDAAPSLRYMTLLREGAAELNLRPCYQAFLANHPVQYTPKWLKRMAVYNMIATLSISQVLASWRIVSRLQSRVLNIVNVLPTRHAVLQAMGHILQALCLLPGSTTGWILRKRRATSLSPFAQRMLDMIDNDNTTTGSNSSSSSSSKDGNSGESETSNNEKTSN